MYVYIYVCIYGTSRQYPLSDSSPPSHLFETYISNIFYPFMHKYDDHAFSIYT